MTVTEVRPLAGVSFEDVPPMSPRVLPRMDVVGFVGYARSGPVHTPVPIESVEDFRRVFGGDDVDLGWDEVRRRPVTSQLGTAVRDFFVNGGTRAWVVRAAGRTEPARAPLPGVLRLGPDGLAVARLAAASPGAAGGDAELACTLMGDPVQVLRREDDVLVTRGRTLVVGDLLRVPLAEHEAYVQVTQVATDERPTRTARTALGEELSVGQRIRVSAPLISVRRDALVRLHAGVACVLDADGTVRCVQARLDGDAPTYGFGYADPVALVVWQSSSRPRPVIGSWVRLMGWVSAPIGPADAWVAVDDVGPSSDDDHASVVRGRVCVPEPAATWDLPPGGVVEALTLEVHGRYTGRRSAVTGLGLLSDHPRFVGFVPDAAGRLRPEDDRWAGDLAALRDSEFPWAGDRQPGMLLPLLAGELPTTWAPAFERTGTRLGIDGLGKPDALAFVDEKLVDQGVDTLVGRAEDLRWRGARPYHPRGIHALLGIDEVTVVAVPDAAQVGWCPASVPDLADPPPSEDDVLVQVCDHGDFDDCETARRPAAPVWSSPVLTGEGMRLAWTRGDEDGRDGDEDDGDREDLEYVVAESVDPTGWQDARVIHRGSVNQAVMAARSTLPRYYRVRAEAGRPDGTLVGPWSAGLGVAASPGLGFAAVADDDYRPDVLLDVQRALLRMCAARGDLLAVLSMPEHYRADEVAAHVRSLTRPQGTPGPGDVVPPLGPWETPVLGYGAVYHPWLVNGALDVASSATIGVPDGAVAGVIAARARTRGAWVAPANEPLHDVVALAHDEPLAALLLLRANQANAVVRTRDSFRSLSEDTLAADPDWRPISVRRLHSLLRRVALLEGPHYVFEPNDPVLRRGIERGFVELMRFLHGLGAFAGRTEREAFRVSVGDVNTPVSIDAGRLVVEIAYAPSRPLEFLRVRLVRAGEPGFRLVGS